MTIAATAVVVTASAPKAPPVAVPVTEAPDTGSALVAARAQGTEVEALNLRTSTREVFAQPDGQLKALLSATPQRVQTDGKWTSINTDLAPESGGVAPKATGTGLVFSDGGANEPLVRLSKDGRSFELTWQGDLPAPALDGPVATYSEVLPGVDLRMIARNDGYQQLLVVKNREAAKEVARVRFGVKTDGLTLKPGENGAFTMVDAAGATVFEVPASLMWDSKKQENPEAPRTDQQVVGVELTADSLTLVPHQGMLTDPATVYPVYVDPGPHTGTNDGWTTVYDDGTHNMREGTHWNGFNTQAEDPNAWWIGINPTARSGKAYGWNLKTRTYFQYNTSFLSGKEISSARLDVAVVHSPTCNVTHNHRLYQSQWDVGSGTNWNNQPADWGSISEIGIPAVYNGCSGHKYLSFTAGNFPDQIDKGGNSTFSIRAADEGNQDFWRKFNPGETKLVIYYNGTPNTPTEPSTDLNLQACANCDGMPWVGDSTIQLRARLSDPDGDQVNGVWDVYDDVVPGDPAKQNKRVLSSGPHGSGSLAAKDVSLAKVDDDRLVTWFVAASDGAKQGGYVIGPKQFRVDRTAPVNMPDVTSLAYPADNRWHGGTTVAGKFTFTAKDADVDRFEYTWDDGQWTESVNADRLGGTATVTLTPPGDGPRDLFVRVRDKAGNPGPKQIHHIYVRAGSGAIAQYTMDGNVNDSAYLGDRHGTTHGTTSYSAGASGSALTLDGMGGHATAPNSVRTDSSFSVSAWVRLDGGLDQWWRGAVSQDGNSVCGFCLQYQADVRRWVFVMPQQDSANPANWAFVKSLEEPTLGAWTHLTGTFDAETKQVRLYVNGVPQGTGLATSPWNAAGDLRIGQGKAANAFGNNWLGAIDDVRTYDRALTDIEVRGEVRRDNVQAGHWRFEEDRATVARNSATNGESAALSGGVSFFEQRSLPKDYALRFDGSGQVRTTGPVVRTDKSFSVSAHVTLTDTNVPMTVLSQDGPDSSGFVLQQKDGRWQFGMTEGNGNTAWNVLAQTAPGTAVKDTPTHLAAVFDSGTKKATLYVNGLQPAVSAAATKPFWDSAGAFVMGNDQQGAALQGDLDDVRVYSRTLAADEIADIVELDAGPLRQWRMDDVGVDTSGYNGTASLGDPVSWVGGQSENSDPKDLAVRLTGVPGASLYASHVLDTSRNFSVSAWARLDKVVAGQYPTVLSQDGNTTSAFQLQATPDGHWAFAMFESDQAGGGARHDRAIGAVAQLGAWTHLVGTYDAARDVMTLYINGVEAATAAHPNAWNHATGQFRIGRGLWNSAQANYFPGAIDDVEVHNRVLFADEIRDKAGRDLSLVHKWQFDEGVGTNAADSVGGKAGTLTNATYAPGRLGNAASFNGTNAEVSTGAVVRTDQNFTVSAWVKLPEDACTATCKRVAVSQDGEHNSKFRLGFLKDRDHLGNWVFEMTEDDTDATRVTVAAVSAEIDDFSGWVHLVGVYDRAAKQVLLYVEGNRVGEGVVNSTWQANGGLQIGRAKLRSAPAERWLGSIDDVRFYTGALDNEGVFGLYGSYPSQDQPVATLPVADAGHWKFREATGLTGADSSGRGNTVTLSPGSGWISGPANGGVWLNGTSQAGETAGPIIDTSRSYSVSAWAYAENGITGNKSIVAQDGTHDSAFALSYNGDSGRWAVVAPNQDVNGGSATVLVSSEPAQLTRWTHLTVVYEAPPHEGSPDNASSKQLRLYVNGVLSAVQVGVVGWNATGPFTIGRSKWDGVKGSWWYRGVEDVRAYSRALTSGEVGKVYGDHSPSEFGLYDFNGGNANDSSWRANNLTPSSGTSYVPGVFGSALKFDGTASAPATALGANTRDSFSVQAWARLDDDKRTYTVFSQDGNRVSGYALQYRAESKRWSFGSHVQDSDAAPMMKALSAEQAVPGRWTHLAGVYDHAAGQLRLYVDGKLAGTEKFQMWNAEGRFALGRAKAQGADADRFAGLIDEVRVQQGVATEARILANASRPLPAAGQLGRFVNEKGEHYTGPTDVPALPGYRFETPRGMTVAPTDPNTVRLYSCKQGEDHFTAIQADCEGATLLSEIGAVYSVKPTNIPTIGLYRCFTGVQRFDSTAENCEGSIFQKQLGWVRAYTILSRHFNGQWPTDHWSSPHNTSPGYYREGPLGTVLLIDIPGQTASLNICQDGSDVYTSLDANCDGKTRISGGGRVYSSPPDGLPSKPLDRCKQTGVPNLNRFDSVTGCGTHELQQRLGYVLVSAPTVAPTF
ncbi:Concanavalin A-like lectin/glucanases superfamily protein [Lentzea waywayandensis]|uniref:Concanavalin A-like lectin/glucanases superfamily protein n=1 Tax=Lentzea waywayandensis TaxID=84724 RepID=A0A1I6FA13_9PSEU|nr:LamG-like jellyroll fold domain-containing protein [Lentzea waywayandensis]SFR26778.1 Concanavalin A-like lectin/glucanases superfamily protein [Lentzea waywayandensis]